jgi:hypothetical protein
MTCNRPKRNQPTMLTPTAEDRLERLRHLSAVRQRQYQERRRLIGRPMFRYCAICGDVFRRIGKSAARVCSNVVCQQEKIIQRRQRRQARVKERYNTDIQFREQRLISRREKYTNDDAYRRHCRALGSAWYMRNRKLKLPRQKECVVCRAIFWQNHSRVKTCSDACRTETKRQLQVKHEQRRTGRLRTDADYYARRRSQAQEYYFAGSAAAKAVKQMFPQASCDPLVVRYVNYLRFLKDSWRLGASWTSRPIFSVAPQWTKETVPVIDLNGDAKSQTTVYLWTETFADVSVLGPPPYRASVRRQPDNSIEAIKKRAYYLANKTKILARTKKYHEANKERTADYKRRWAKSEKAQEWRAVNRDKIIEHKREYSRKYREENRERLSLKRKMQRMADPSVLDTQREYWRKPENCERRRKRKLEQYAENRDYINARRRAVIDKDREVKDQRNRAQDRRAAVIVLRELEITNPNQGNQ